MVERARAAAEAEGAPGSPSSSAGGGARETRGHGEADEDGDVPADKGAEQGAGTEDMEGRDEEVKRAPPMGLPISVVKRIMSCDEDVQRMTSGAVRATARAAELFMQVVSCPRTNAYPYYTLLHFTLQSHGNVHDRWGCHWGAGPCGLK